MTHEQEITEFKQKMIFGIRVIKIPASHLHTFKPKDIIVRLKGSGKDLSVTWESKKVRQ